MLNFFDKYKISKMSKKVVENDPYVSEFNPDWYVTSKKVENCGGGLPSEFNGYKERKVLKKIDIQRTVTYSMASVKMVGLVSPRK